MSQPYKFLDYYDYDEAAKFFGRERETEVLLSDIVATRLVLLFARTGSGKTSLINAGARPRLEQELGYRTFYVRVERDPVASARAALKAARLLPRRVRNQSLAFQLRDTVRRLRTPVVVFFDQFEEFFEYVVQPNPEQARRFIANVGELYRDHDSGVNFVFSFREEFFIEMDIFRDEIPGIFHNESNLRLLWLDREQAREAVLRPARAARFRVGDDLVERLLSDLSVEDRDGTPRVEPARLQIVCDTLWRERSRGRATLALYEQLGGSEKILERRLEADINRKLTDGQLRLFERLVPRLANEKRGTKYVRGFEELVKDLGTGRETLRETVEQLKGLHLLRESKRYGEVYVEWMSDYLAVRTQDLRDSVRAISLRRLLKSSMAAARKRAKAAKASTQPPTETVLRDLYMAPSDFEELSAGIERLEELMPAELEFLFVAALEHGAHTRLWFDRAQDDPVGRAAVWAVLENRVDDPKARVEQCENAVRLLATLPPKRAEDLLKRALKQKALAPTAVNIIGELAAPDRAVSLLKRALSDKELKRSAVAALGQVRSFDAGAILEELLYDRETATEAAGALEGLSKSRDATLARLAAGALRRWQKAPNRQPRPYVSSEGGIFYLRPQAPRAGERGLTESLWTSLLHRVRDGALVPFLGPQASPQFAETVALHAQHRPTRFKLPPNTLSLSRIALTMSRRFDPEFAKRHLGEEMRRLSRRRKKTPDPVHEALSRLPLPLYLTTDYADGLRDALGGAGKRPKTLQTLTGEMMQWQGQRLVSDDRLFFWNRRDPDDELIDNASPTSPAVFHLLGHYSKPANLVLSEDDAAGLFVYLQVWLSVTPGFLKRIMSGLNLYVGFDPAGWEYRVVRQGLIRRAYNLGQKRMSIVQLPPAAQGDYAETGGLPYGLYLERQGFKVYWGTAEEFAVELLERWKKFSK